MPQEHPGLPHLEVLGHRLDAPGDSHPPGLLHEGPRGLVVLLAHPDEPAAAQPADGATVLPARRGQGADGTVVWAVVLCGWDEAGTVHPGEASGGLDAFTTGGADVRFVGEQGAGLRQVAADQVQTSWLAVATPALSCDANLDAHERSPPLKASVTGRPTRRPCPAGASSRQRGHWRRGSRWRAVRRGCWPRWTAETGTGPRPRTGCRPSG